MKVVPASMTLTLSSVGNPDYGQYYGKNVLSPTQRVKVRNFAEASEFCRAYIAKYDLGAGNWTDAIIRHGKRSIARVSYNGRVWPVAEWNSHMSPLYEPKRAAK